MKILVISDSHNHIANIKAVMEIAKKSNIKAVVHCGDWDDIRAIEAVLNYDIPLYTILGNADVNSDLESYLRLNAKKFDPDYLKFEIDGRKIGVTHRVREKDLRHEKLDVVFSGHYHSSEEKIIDFRKFVRPGALINGLNFAVYETETNEVEFVKNE
jgi:putative phosphoesterase